MNITVRIIAVAICAVVGIVLLWKPEILWRLRYWWAVSKDSSPSSFYVIIMRVLGAGFLVGAAILVVSLIRK